MNIASSPYVRTIIVLSLLSLHFHVAVVPRGAVCNATAAAMTDRASERLYRAPHHAIHANDMTVSHFVLVPSLSPPSPFLPSFPKTIFSPPFPFCMGSKQETLLLLSVLSFRSLPIPEMMEYEKYKLSETTAGEGEGGRGRERGSWGLRRCVCIGCARRRGLGGCMIEESQSGCRSTKEMRWRLKKDGLYY